MYDNILLPTDGSDGAVEALEHAIAEAEAHDAALSILSVADRRVVLAADRDDTEGVKADLRAEAEDAVATLADIAETEGIETSTAVREGVPYREIRRYADDTGIDLLVVGTHGRTGREKRLNLGSTTERLIKGAGRPVLVVDISE
ncbi:MAG: universal stress protein [Natronomonas sp.]